MQIAPFPRRVISSSEACLAESQFFPHYLINALIYGEKIIGHKMWTLFVCTDVYESVVKCSWVKGGEV